VLEFTSKERIMKANFPCEKETNSLELSSLIVQSYGFWVSNARQAVGVVLAGAEAWCGNIELLSMMQVIWRSLQDSIIHK